MPRPHVHPSKTCYDKHGCRCAACTEFYAEHLRVRAAAKYRARARKTPLTDEQIAALRRQAGLDG
jgi:hypothetical protein